MRRVTLAATFSGLGKERIRLLGQSPAPKRLSMAAFSENTLRESRGIVLSSLSLIGELLRTPLLRSSRGELTYPIAPALMLQVEGQDIGHSLRAANISLQ